MIGVSRDFASQRARMVERQLRRRGIADKRVLAVIGTVPRERFVGAEVRRRAYDDSALPIGHEQTISQPWIVAAICQALQLTGDERVLEIGAGSGYSTAVLACLCDEIVTVERIPALAQSAAERLADLGVTNARVIEGDGSAGLPAEAPFGGMAVHAAAPTPSNNLIEQLAPNARLVVPIASGGVDMLTVFKRVSTDPPDIEAGIGLERQLIGPCRFVPLIGRQGLSPD